MKYNSYNKPLACIMTQSTCYRGTSKMTPKGVLWHSTGANNPTLRRYVQPDDNAADRAALLAKIGTNSYGNDWNHIYVDAGVTAWIGKLADGTVASVQTLPWDYKPWGCGSGSRGSCNNGWMQFEICESDLSDKTYFSAVYNEACELTAYYCKMYGINPKGTVTYNGVKVPTILCHQDSYQLGLGGNHADVYHWFNKHGKTMDDVRNDVAKLLETDTPVKVGEYKVVIDINVYATAADAKAKTNPIKTYPAGTYYIFTKYPSGVDGMLNITKDATGSAAGGWINPAENVEKVKEDTVTKLYRVRKSKDDSKSQKGAFASLENAKACCQSAGEGYHVFDWDFNIVYSYITTVVDEKQEEKDPENNIAVYDLDYADKVPIVDQNIKRTNADCAKVIKKVLLNNNNFDINIAKAFFKLAPKYGIDPMMAIAQSVLETGWFNYKGSAVTADQHNYCGLGVTSNGKTGASFNTIEDGVTAQLQHLFAYGSNDSLPEDTDILDPRFSLVTRGVAPYWQQLAGRWAVPGYDTNVYDTPQKAMEARNTYGQKILTICNSFTNTAITDEDIKKYFPDNNADTDDKKQDIKANLIDLIFNIIKNLIRVLSNLFTKGE